MKAKRIIAAVCIFACLFTLSACSVNVNSENVQVDIGNSEDVNYVTKTYDITDSFDNISLQTGVDEINFVASEDGKCSVVCVEDETKPHTVGSADNTLTIAGETEDETNGLNTSVTVYLPAKAYGDIDVETGVGNITIGKTDCANLVANTSVGSVTLTDVVATGNIQIDVATGSIEFDNCDAGAITAGTGVGDITGTLLTAKNFSATAELGSVDVPDSTSGGSCELTSSMGSIKISVK